MTLTPPRSRPSLLFVTSELPWPLDSGGHVRSYYLLRALSRVFAVRLVAGVASDRETLDDPFASFDLDVRAVPLQPRTPIREATRAAVATILQQPYVFFHRHNRRAMRAAVREELASRPPRLLYCDHLDSFLFARDAIGVPYAIDLHNVYSLIARRAAEEPDRPWIVRQYLAREARLLERMESEAVRGASAVFTVSELERTHFERIRRTGIHVVPNGVAYSQFATLPAGRRRAAPIVLFVGSLSWPPNVAAVKFLVTQVLPRVRDAVPAARLAVVGRNPATDVLALAAPPLVTIHANVPDVMPYLLEAKCLAVPLATGGGTRLKILEAFAAGLPVVSTPVGAEGIAATADRDLIVATHEEFAARLGALLSDDTAGERLAASARELARTRYDWEAIGAGAAKTLAAQVAPHASTT